MGQNGVDIILSPSALKIIPFDIEAKNVEKLNIVGVFKEHLKRYALTNRLKMLIHSRNRSETLITMRWTDFLDVFRELLTLQRPSTPSTDVSKHEAVPANPSLESRV